MYADSGVVDWDMRYCIGHLGSLARKWIARKWKLFPGNMVLDTCTTNVQVLMQAQLIRTWRIDRYVSRIICKCCVLQLGVIVARLREDLIILLVWITIVILIISFLGF